MGDLADINQSPWDPSEGGTINYLDLTGVLRAGRVIEPRETQASRAPSRARRRAVSGDILVSTVRPYLRGFALIRNAPANLIVSTGFAVISARAEADRSYLFQHILSDDFIGYLKPRMTGSNYPAVRPADVADYPIPLPPPDERRRIGQVLDAIDEAIAQSEKAIAACEILRQTLLHELLARGVPGWHTEWRGVPRLGAVPRCWAMVRLGDAYDIELGKMVSPQARSGASKRLYVTNRNVRWGRFDLLDVPQMHFDPDELERYRLRSGDLLVCESGEVGRAAIWQEELAECYYQKALHRLRPRQVGQQPRFLRLLLEHASGVGFLADKAPKTSIAHLTRETLVRLSLPLPDPHEQVAIADAIETVEARIAASREAMASLRVVYARAADALLQGQLRTVNATPRQAAGVK